MGSDVDELLQAIADEIATQKERGHLSYETLESQLRELAAVNDLDPKKVAFRVKQLVHSSQRRAWWKSPFVPIAATGMISMVLSVILSVALCILVAPKLLNRAGTAAPAAVPTDLKLEADSLSLPADGTSDTRIRATVLDQFGQPMSDGTPIEFRILPSDIGTIEPNRAAVVDGHVETVFRAGNTPGEVQITAWVGAAAQQTIAINLADVTRPKLVISICSEPTQKAVRGGQVSFTFDIANNGDALAAGVTAFGQVPEGTVFGGASDEGRADNDGLVVWQIGDLAPDQTAGRTLTVTVDQNLPVDSIITVTDYGVWYGSDQEVRGQEQANLEVEEAIPTKIDLVADPPIVLADGVSTALIVAKVFDQQGNMIINGPQVTFSLQPSGMGNIQPATASTTLGEARAIFTAGATPGGVEIAAGGGTATIAIHIDLVSRGRVSVQAHLFCSPEEDTNRLIVFQIPAGTPIELLDEVQGDFARAALRVWVPRSVLSTDSKGQSTIVSYGQEVFVGEIPEDSPDVQSQLHQGALDIPVQILDNGRPDYVRIKVVGWILLGSIEEGE